MIYALPTVLFIVYTIIKIINYGRWAGKQGNRRGAIGLYLLAFLCLLVPSGVFIFIEMR